MFEPVKVAFGEFMGRFYDQLIATTQPMEEFVARGLSRSIMLAPGRMIDAADSMFRKYLRIEHEDTDVTLPHKLPVILCAFARDFSVTGRDYSRLVGDRQMVVLPDDPKQRMFGLRMMSADIRVQVVVFATDEPSAKSIAGQFALFLDETFNRRFWATYRFAGVDCTFPCQIDSPEVYPALVQNDARNLTILAMDLTLKCAAPLFDAPKEGEPNDGKGTAGSKDDPAGYPVVDAIKFGHFEGEQEGNNSRLTETTADFVPAAESGAGEDTVEVKRTYGPED